MTPSSEWFNCLVCQPILCLSAAINKRRQLLDQVVQILFHHFNDVTMSSIASHITSLTVVYSPVYSDADQRKHQSSASLAFVWGIHRDRWITRIKGQLRGKCFQLMTSSCDICTWFAFYCVNVWFGNDRFFSVSLRNTSSAKGKYYDWPVLVKQVWSIWANATHESTMSRACYKTKTKQT